ncbi:hypothetical protein [Amycolatopsis sacchari]|uniref:hypothetical protein n=1 Tax=Amycolatopsis sacchari TaxID=115433 RepID=UPI001178C1FB|nr:hypothetical protein [Amycolatopsis sacchari]
MPDQVQPSVAGVRDHRDALDLQRPRFQGGLAVRPGRPDVVQQFDRVPPRPQPVFHLAVAQQQFRLDTQVERAVGEPVVVRTRPGVLGPAFGCLDLPDLQRRQCQRPAKPDFVGPDAEFLLQPPRLAEVLARLLAVAEVEVQFAEPGQREYAHARLPLPLEHRQHPFRVTPRAVDVAVALTHVTGDGAGTPGQPRPRARAVFV